MKYDRIVEINKNKCQQNVELVNREIQKMLERRERISVTALAEYTGLSRRFFYQNKQARELVSQALLQQGEAYNPKKVIFDNVMAENNLNLKKLVMNQNKEIEKLKKQNQELIDLNEKLKSEIDRLKNR